MCMKYLVGGCAMGLPNNLRSFLGRIFDRRFFQKLFISLITTLFIAALCCVADIFFGFELDYERWTLRKPSSQRSPGETTVPKTLGAKKSDRLDPIPSNQSNVTTVGKTATIPPREVVLNQPATVGNNDDSMRIRPGSIKSNNKSANPKPNTAAKSRSPFSQFEKTWKSKPSIVEKDGSKQFVPKIKKEQNFTEWSENLFVQKNREVSRRNSNSLLPEGNVYLWQKRVPPFGTAFPDADNMDLDWSNLQNEFDPSVDCLIRGGMTNDQAPFC